MAAALSRWGAGRTDREKLSAKPADNRAKRAFSASIEKMLRIAFSARNAVAGP